MHISLRLLITSALEEEGLIVRTAVDGLSILDLLHSSARNNSPPPDALIMDIRMPHYTGLDVLQALRLSRWRVPVVLMTAFPDQETLRMATWLGAACTLAKPVAMEDVVRAVTSVIELAKQQAFGDAYAR